MYNIRQEQMREYIEQKNIVTIKELQVLFPDVSLMTIHRETGSIAKTAAAAVLPTAVGCVLCIVLQLLL